MDHIYIPELPVSIVDAALSYVNENYPFPISRELLTELYWRIRWRRDDIERLKKKNKTLKVSSSFRTVRNYVLDQLFPVCGPEARALRSAYASGLGKIGQEFRKRAQPGLQLKRTELERIMDQVTLSKDRRQYRLDL